MKKIFIFSLFIFFFSLFFAKVTPSVFAACVAGTGSTPVSCGGHASYHCDAINGCEEQTYRCEGDLCVPRDHIGVGMSFCTAAGLICNAPPPPPPVGGCTVAGQVDPHFTCNGNACTSTPGCGISSCTGPTDTTSCTTIGGCPICTPPFSYNPFGQTENKKCIFAKDSGDAYSPPTSRVTCTAEQTCKSGCGCNCALSPGFTSGSLPCGADGKTCFTAFGNISLDPASLAKAFFGIILSISGGIAVLLIILAGYRLLASQGNPEKINEAKEHLTAAIVGLLFIIFSFAILRFIGVDILGIFP